MFNKKLDNRIIIASIVTILAFTLLVANLYSKNNHIKIDNLVMRTGPSINYPIQAKLKSNTRFTIVNKKHNWTQIKINDNKGWVPTWLLNKPVTNFSNLSEATIVIDAGHGGNDVGALSIDNQYEKKYTLQLAKATYKKLKATGANVIMTRASDTTVPLAQRPIIAQNNFADAFISFHFDSSVKNDSASGFTTYFYHAGDSYQLATDLNTSMENLPLNNRGVEYGNYLVVRDTKIPSVLLESGYINSQSDFNLIKDPSYQNKIANDVTTGLKDYFNKK